MGKSLIALLWLLFVFGVYTDVIAHMGKPEDSFGVILSCPLQVVLGVDLSTSGCVTSSLPSEQSHHPKFLSYIFLLKVVLFCATVHSIF